MKKNSNPIETCIRHLRTAFSGCGKPAKDALMSAGGIEYGDAITAWAPLERQDIVDHPGFDSIIGEYLDNLSSDGIRYFLPALLELVLVHPENIDASGLFYLASRFEVMWVYSPDHRYYRGARLTKEQVAAITEWCKLMEGVVEQLEGTEREDEYRYENLKKLVAIRHHLSAARTCVDFDRDFQEKRRAEASRKPGSISSRRHGWQHEKHKKGRRPGKGADPHAE